jgi:hypothetical protein
MIDRKIGEVRISEDDEIVRRSGSSGHEVPFILYGKEHVTGREFGIFFV